jgi:ureidoglycolate lyase
VSRDRDIVCQPLTAVAFAPFGDVLALRDAPDRIINGGMCGRHHDLAHLDFGPEGRAGISLFDAQPRNLPYALDLLERHPEGSQAFIPMTQHPFLVIVSETVHSRPQAFLTAPGQGVNLHRGTWHGVLTPLAAPGLFAVIDRIGAGDNLEEHVLDPPWRIVAGEGGGRAV